MKYFGLAFVLASLSTAVMAEGDGEKDPELTRLEKETALLNAQAARDTAAASVQTARTARVTAQMDALGLTPAEGKTTLGVNAGLIETWMLSASAADAAAAWITYGVRNAPTLRVQATAAPVGAGDAPPPPEANAGPLQQVGGRGAGVSRSAPILLVGGDETINLDMADSLNAQVAAAHANLISAVPQFCRGGAPRPSTSEQGGAFPLAAIGAVAGLLKTDTEISGVDVPLGNRLLMAATGRKLTADGFKVVLPSAAIAPVRDSALAQAWGRMIADRDEARMCRPKFAAQGKTPWITKKLAALDAATAAIDALEAAQLKPDDKGSLPLARAIRAETLLRGNPNVLRLNVEKAGGSILKRSNVWTSLGAPAVGVTGGLIVSYTLTEPTTGGFLGGGALVCRTALTNLRDVQNGRIRKSDRARAGCSPLLDVETPHIEANL